MIILRSVSTLLVALIATVAWCQTPPAASTCITGRVLDSHQAGPLPGATVEVIGTSVVAHTDIDGRSIVRISGCGDPTANPTSNCMHFSS